MGVVWMSDQDMVRITWWSMTGLQEEEIPFEAIEKVELNPTSGSKNPFSVYADRALVPQYCRSIEWPENCALTPEVVE